MAKVSAIIISKNEDRTIARAIKSVSWADEIVVVDSGSTDDTPNAARRCGAKVIFREFDDFSSQKNFAISKCSNDWILSVDCDEVITEGLQKAIKEAVESPDKFSGFRVRRINYIFGKKLSHAAGNDLPMRLFDRRRSVFIQPIHEHVVVEGRTGILEGEMLHYTTSDLNAQLDKTQRYTELEAKWLLERGNGLSLFKSLFYPVAVFLNILIVKRGFLDGYAGLLYAYLSARYTRIKYQKARTLLKMRGFRFMNWKDFYQEPHSLKTFTEQLLLHSEFVSCILKENPKKALEVGVGRGTFIAFLSLGGIECIGIDRDDSVIAKYRAFASSLGIRDSVQSGDAFNMPFTDKEFSLSISQGFFEHFSDKDIHALLDEQLRVANRVLFSVPSKFYRVKDFGNERLMGIDEWKSVLSNYKVSEAVPYCCRRLKKNMLLRLPLMYYFMIEGKKI